jgi:salicylate 5-hydroxylase small subunit
MDRINTPVTFEQFLAIQQIYAEYASAVDARDWERWIEMFTDDCVYRLQPRENHERGLPLATLFFESKGALRDRAYGIQETLFHDPYYQRHVVGAPIIRAAQGGIFDCEANYAVFRTKLSQLSTVFNVGRTIDRLVSTPTGLKFQSRLVVYDSEMIPNSIIYPI